FSASISTPTGGAVLGATTTETVTILDDDAAPPAVSVVEIPTLGEIGQLVLGGLVGLAGLLRLRRRTP
ncbi:MAG TPA: hypothetical protein DD490_27200, partial [Acidobacteria bacterium]|nr:hypothetical protein [Acidobacteriota bacterium]